MTPSSSWRWRQLVREGQKNTNIQTVLLFIMTAAAFSMVGIFIYSTTASALDRESARHSNGSYVWSATMAPDSDAKLDGSACMLLARSSAVTAAGFITAAPNEGWRVIPDSAPLPSRLVSPSILRVFGDDQLLSNVMIGHELARIGLAGTGQAVLDSASGETLRLSGGAAPASGNMIIDSVLLIPVSDSRSVDECHILMRPAAFNSGATILESAFPQAGVHIVKFRDTSTDLSPREQFASTMGWHPGLIGGAVAALLAVAISVLRRNHLMIYRLIGSTPGEIGAMLIVEYLAAFAAGAALAIPVSWILGFHIGSGSPAAPAMLTSGLAILSSFITALAISALTLPLTTRGNPLASLRDR